MSSALSATPAVLTVEIDPAAAIEGRPPEPLSRENAELLAGPIADDLRRIVGETVADAGLIMPAGLYDLTELLRPGLPMVEALLDLYRGSLRGGPFQPQLLALGSAGGRFPGAGLAPERQRGAGPLLALPLALVAPGETLDPLRRSLEQVLLEKGRASLATDRTIRQLFGVEPVHLSYATFHDLSALMKVQLEHAGFGDLWQLVEGALYRPDAIEKVETATGNTFLGSGGTVYTPIRTFNQQAARANTEREATANAYIEWVKIQRQYTLALTHHDIVVRHCEPQTGIDAADAEVAMSIAQAAALPAESSWYTEPVATSEPLDGASIVTLTEQFDTTLGPVAYTVLVQAGDGRLLRLEHDYPLTPTAVDAIKDHWRAQAGRLGANFQVERPGRLIAGGQPAQLRPWLDYAGEA
jgi:hypothetical protein